MDTMTELKAKPVVKDKFWIVEQDGEKVATIQAVEEGGFVYVHDDRREQFDTVHLLKNRLNIKFDRATVKKIVKVKEHEVYGWPADCKPHNKLYDVSRKLPIYTKAAKSKSYFCAGFYIVKLSNWWTAEYCPKLITLQRYEFAGPYHTVEQQQDNLKIANGQ